MEATSSLFDRIINPDLLVRRVNISANRLINEEDAPKNTVAEQLDFYSQPFEIEERERERKEEMAKERKKQEAMLTIKKKYGKNAIVKGMNLEDGATTISRNKQIGGHKA